MIKTIGMETKIVLMIVVRICLKKEGLPNKNNGAKESLKEGEKTQPEANKKGEGEKGNEGKAKDKSPNIGSHKVKDPEQKIGGMFY